MSHAVISPAKAGEKTSVRFSRQESAPVEGRDRRRWPSLQRVVRDFERGPSEQAPAKRHLASADSRYSPAEMPLLPVRGRRILVRKPQYPCISDGFGDGADELLCWQCGIVHPFSQGVGKSKMQLIVLAHQSVTCVVDK